MTEMKSLLNPSSLSSGVETGLGNELWSLAGWLLIASNHNRTLCLPPFTSNVHAKHTRLIPFKEVFNATRFQGGMRMVNITVDICDQRGNELSRQGWTHYKKVFSSYRAKHGGWHPKQNIVTQMFSSLYLSNKMARMVANVISNINLKRPYACVHARVEKDARFLTPRRPTLADYERAAAEFNSSVFWASSSKINAQGVQAMQKAKMDTVNQSFTYFHASLIDFSICKEATYFAGMAESSFSRIIAELRAEKGQGWTVVCQEFSRHFSAQQKHVLYTNWTLCPRTNHRYRFGSFGWVQD